MRTFQVGLASVSILAAIPVAAQDTRSLDLTINHVGISIGDSRRTTGLRLNYRDREMREVIGVNATIWIPYNGSRGTVRGLALGLPATGARQINGIAIGVIGVGAEDDIQGLALGGIGMGVGDDMQGIALGGIGLGAGHDMKGIAAGGIGLGIGNDLTGLGVGGIGLGVGRDLKGIALGGIGMGVGGDMHGLAAGGIGVAAGGDVTGILIGVS